MKFQEVQPNYLPNFLEYDHDYFPITSSIFKLIFFSNHFLSNELKAVGLFQAVSETDSVFVTENYEILSN